MRYIIVFLIIPLLSCAQPKINNIEVVLPGVFQTEEYLPYLEGKRVGIVANRASTLNGIHDVDTLVHLIREGRNNFRLETIFSPEHGFSMVSDAGEIIESEEQLYDSIKIVSLYGSGRKPDSASMNSIDVMLFDLQDVGARFYTYISTMHYVMEACAEYGIPLIVLDRPNPHAHYVDGPILEEKYKSFVGMHPVPVVYGMTIGEYAKMINGEGWLDDSLQCDLKVVAVKNYNRNSVYDFPIKPSPNLPNMESVLLYPSICFFEGTVMSLGRGTSAPFQVLGHPDYPVKSFSFTPVSTPGASLYPKLENEQCYGTDLSVISLDSLRNANKINLDYLLSNYAVMPLGNDFFIDYFTTLAGTRTLQEQIVAGKTEKEIRASWKPGLDKFKEIRKKYLIYK